MIAAYENTINGANKIFPSLKNMTGNYNIILNLNHFLIFVNPWKQNKFLIILKRSKTHIVHITQQVTWFNRKFKN